MGTNAGRGVIDPVFVFKSLITERAPAVASAMLVMVWLALTDATAATGAANGASGATVTFVSLSRWTVGGLETGNECTRIDISVFVGGRRRVLVGRHGCIFYVCNFYGEIYKQYVV